MSAPAAMLEPPVAPEFVTSAAPATALEAAVERADASIAIDHAATAAVVVPGRSGGDTASETECEQS